MLLTELLHKTIPNIKSTNKSTSGILINPNKAVIGVGAQTIAYLHKKFPTKIIKTIQITGSDDPSYQFLRLVLKHQKNPYFPKIYSVKQYRTSQMSYINHQDEFSMIDHKDEFSPAPDQLTYTLIVVTERLNPLRDLNTKDLEMLGIEDVEVPNRLKQHKRISAIKFKQAFLDPIYRKKMIQTATDPWLKQALRLLEPLFRNYGPDMHDGNIMTRDDQHWVFVDPITYYSDDK
ncbi:MAG: hypothetical protein ACXW2E_01225 [Nitrososphaeraceae archaeon]